MKQTTYFIHNLCCANCAAKIEARINALPEVDSAVIVFATGQLRVTASDPEGLLPRLQAIVSAIEPDARIAKEPAHAHTCSCDHCHEHSAHSHTEGLLPVLIGAGLFVLGMVLQRLFPPVYALAAFLCAYVLLGHGVLLTAAKNLFRGHVFDENFLMAIATIGAFAIGQFPEAVGVMLFFRIGTFFEEKAVAHSRKQIMDAVDLRPQTVTLWSGQTIPAQEAQPGDLLLIRPGDRIGLDGCVFSGESAVDTSPITGEHVPVAVKPGDDLLSGCINTTGQLVLQVTKPLSESMVTRILQAVENAAASKPKMDRFITRFARIYTPVVVSAAVLIAIVPSLITGQWNYWVYTALSFLVMSCPCALVLSVPLAFFCGIGLGSKKGILFKGGASMEALAAVSCVALDKTGTLTQGDFRVQQVDGDVLQVAACCELHSTHPIGASIVAYAREQGLPLSPPAALEEFPGHGVHAQLEGRRILCGNAGLLERFGICVPVDEIQDATAVYVAIDHSYAGRILISDRLKPHARQTVERLHAMGLHTALLTGDHAGSAQAVAEKTGIGQVFSKLLPEDKLATLAGLRKAWGKTLFVGDGINDAPVLAGADVGAAMGSGSDAAIEAADAVFMTQNLSAIADSVQISRRAKRIALQNVVFALSVKGIVMALGLLGFANMWLAVFADSGVAMLCVLNSVRLLYANRKKQETFPE